MYDPKSDGVAERPAQESKEQQRVTKIALQRRTKTKISPKAPILQWIVTHAMETINRSLVGADGRTPRYRLHGKDFDGNVTREKSLKSRAT